VASNSCLLLGSILSLVLQVEANGQLEIHLNGSALVLSVQSIENLYVNLRAVEGTVADIVGPGPTKVVQSLCQGSLSLVPLLFGAKSIFGTSGELQFKGKAKDAVDVV
jgi:hypothetical protein